MAILSGFEKQKKYITDENKDHKLVSEWTHSDTVDFGGGYTLTERNEVIDTHIRNLQNEKLDNEGDQVLSGAFSAWELNSNARGGYSNRLLKLWSNYIQGYNDLNQTTVTDTVINPYGGRLLVGRGSKRAVVFETEPSYVYDDNHTQQSDPNNFKPKVMVNSVNEGQIVASSYSIEKSVPSTAELTDQNVRQIGSSLNEDLRVLLSGTADNTTRIEACRKDGALTFNPSTDKLTCAGVVQATDFVRSSSKYVKKNIEAVSEDDAKKVLELKPVTFDYIDGAKDQCGLIAEEVLDVLPNVVTVPKGYTEFDPKNPTNTPSIDYSKLVPYLIKMIQMLQDEIDELKKEK